MKSITFALLFLLAPAVAQAQSCYSQAFGAPLADPYQAVGAPVCVAQQQVVSVALPQVQYQAVQVPVQTTVAVQVPVQTVQTVAVAVPQVQYQAVAVAVPHCVVGVASCGVGNVGMYGAGFRTTGSFNSGFVGANRFGAIGGGGVQASFADRRGNVVNALGARRVDVQRGLFGNIQAVSVDGGRGLLGRIK